MDQADVVETYWRLFTRSTSPDRAERLCADDDLWAFDAVESAVDSGDAEAIALIIALADAAPSDAALGYLGAGPIENLLRRADARTKAMVDEAAHQNPRLHQALQSAW